MMKSDPGASFDCPLVLEESPRRMHADDNRKRQSVICIDEDSDEDRKIPAKPSRKKKRVRLAASPKEPRGPQTLCRRPWTSTAASLHVHSSDSDDDDADAALAKQLQREDWGSRRRKRKQDETEDQPDASLAALLKAEKEYGEEDEELNRLVMESDASLAARLQREEENEKERRMKEEKRAMKQSLDGRAWLFVNQVLDLHKRLSPSAPGPTTVAVDDMVFLGKNFLQCVEDFDKSGWPCRVQLAYHYTGSDRMDTIKQDGLMTLADRRKTYNNSHGVGVFGDGIYTARNPFAFRHFGDTGLLVAALLGNSARVSYATPKSKLKGTINTVIGNKSLRRLGGDIPEASMYTDELVLQESKQCLPLMRFDTASVSTQAGKDAVWKFHQEVQRLLDRVFNKGVRTQLKRIDESASDPYRALRGGGGAAARMAALAAARPPASSSWGNPFAGLNLPGQAGLFAGLQGAGLPSNLLASLGTGSSHGGRNGGSPAAKPEVLTYTAPQVLTTSAPSDAFVSCKKGSKEDCVICMESLAKSGRVVRLRDCGHEYHKQCIKGALKSSNKCPVCRALITKPQGRCPSGTMSITTSSMCCSGFESCGRSIVITYNMPSGTQLPYHENPGQRFQGAMRTAYLPDNDDGRKLLKRLKFAWTHGLTFTVGTSLTTRQPNCITWASIHHKTSPSGGHGQHGFPDPGFFLNCNGELDAAGVPK